LAEHFVDLLQAHPRSLENLHRLPPEEPMTNTINLRKRALSQEALNLIGITNDLTVLQQTHDCSRGRSRIIRFAAREQYGKSRGKDSSSEAHIGRITRPEMVHRMAESY